jgi:hypothetical protein
MEVRVLSKSLWITFLSEIIRKGVYVYIDAVCLATSPAVIRSSVPAKRRLPVRQLSIVNQSTEE